MASFFDKLANKVNELGNKVVEKTTTSTENIRLTTSIKDEERQIANAYQEIGKKYRELCGANPAPEFAAFLEDIEKRELLITEYRKKIQQNRGRMNCESCGNEIECTAVFCAKCGAKNPVAEEIAKAKAEAEAKAAAEAAAKAAAEAQAAAEAAAAPTVEAAEAVAPAVALKTCANCGTVIAEGNVFCTNCGTRQD
ncbi:MAG: zinc-ribbon domain-containing protein [Ruminococcus sp.]|nr:zinc-ribbon domain-containing protein [Ruminococcus sp.]